MRPYERSVVSTVNRKRPFRLSEVIIFTCITITLSSIERDHEMAIMEKNMILYSDFEQ